MAVAIAWDELNELTRPDMYTVLNLRERFHERASDPRQEFWTLRQWLPQRAGPTICASFTPLNREHLRAVFRGS